jgi:AmmeMemoRadiSam system protein A
MPVSSCINLSAAEQSELKTLVRQVLNDAVTYKKLIIPTAPTSAHLLVPRACFVTLYSGQELRGCIGTYRAEQPLWQNVCQYSYYSACEDRRFARLAVSELDNIRFEISILSELLPMQNNGEQALLQQLEVGVDGLLLKENSRRAIFLPSVWQTLTTPNKFVQALKQKGSWPENYWSKGIQLYRFTATVIEGSIKH